ncbi:MAG: hypothetical protein AAF098_20100 [Pseudomonadota bacterium]
MNILKSTIATSALAVLLAGEAFAGPIVSYKVSNATKNGNDIGHGLWTSNQSDFTPNQFSINPDTWFQIYDINGVITGYLFGSATQQGGDGYTAEFDITLTGFQDETGGDPEVKYKKEHGIAYADSTNDPNDFANPGNNDIDFFSEISGTILFSDAGDDTDVDVEFCKDGWCGYVFQFGVGASAKSKTAFGGSVWLDNPDITNGHWDFNLDFEVATPDDDVPNRVPAPSSLLLLSLGLLIPASRRKLSTKSN